MLNPCVPGGYQAMASMFLLRRGGAGHAEPLRAWRLAASRRWLRFFLLGLVKARVSKIFWGGFTLLKGPAGIHKNQFGSPKRGGAGGTAPHAEPLRACRLAGDGFA